MSRWEDKYVIGLTGNIAVGKSVVRQMLQHLGAYTIDADGLSHQAMAPGAPAYQPVIEMFGRFIVSEDGSINRAVLGSIVFSFPDALAKLEAIVHPVVNQAITTLISRAKQKVIVVEAIKLLESSLADQVSAIWVVDASPETQLRRLTDKRKMSEDEARKRIIAQRPQAAKIQRASVIIMNDGSVEDTWKQVQNAWNAAFVRSQPAPAPAPQPITTAATIPVARPVAAPAPAPAPAPAAVGVPVTDVAVRRGMPGNAELIARFITKATGKAVERMDIMLAFGQKSYLLAQDRADTVVGLMGWQVENLITRVDEFYVDPNAPRDPVIRALIAAIEEASKELQSEVCFIFVPRTIPQDMLMPFFTSGYSQLKLEEVKFPAWREAAHEMLSAELQGLMKQLRADRVMKPI